MSSVAPVPQKTQSQKPRRAIPWNRVIHRSGGLLVSLLMLYLAVTGVTMQVLDLHAIFTHAPATDQTVRSMEEGMYGSANFAVIQLTDFSAPALPNDLDINRAVGTVLQAAHNHPTAGTVPFNLPDGIQSLRPGPGPGPGQGGGPGDNGGPRGQEYAPIAWVELRMANGLPIGQVMTGSRLSAFNAQTGDLVTPVLSTGLPRGNSLRERIKKLHRFWNRGDTPGVYFEFLSGVVLWAMIITGMVMYFRLLNTRVRQGRSQMFWIKGGGGWWRSLHRVISVAAAVFLICIAFSGTWIGFESSVGALKRVQQHPTVTGPSRRPNPIDFIIPLRDQEVQEMTANTLTAMRVLHPDAPIKAIRLRIYGQMKQGVVVGGQPTTQWAFNADNGAPVSLSANGYPESGFPFGTQVHENIKHFHSGAMFGVPARMLDLFGGLSLTFLSVSGIVMYFDMWRKRRKAGRGSLFWA